MILGMVGYAQSGKDSAAQALVEDGWKRLAFADQMRDFLYAQDPIVLYPVPEGAPEHTRLSVLVDDIGWERAKLECTEVADLLLRTGTEAGRGVLGEGVWVDALMRKITSRLTVVSDVRFPNEASAIRAHGGALVRIAREGVEPRTLSDGTPHPSDTAMDGYECDLTVENNSTLEVLRSRIRSAAWMVATSRM